MQVILDNLQPLDLWYKLCKATENYKIGHLESPIIAEPPKESRQYQKKQYQRQHQFKKQQTEQKLELSERSPTELCLTPDLTHRTLKNYRLRKPFDL